MALTLAALAICPYNNDLPIDLVKLDNHKDYSGGRFRSSELEKQLTDCLKWKPSTKARPMASDQEKPSGGFPSSGPPAKKRKNRDKPEGEPPFASTFGP